MTRINLMLIDLLLVLALTIAGVVLARGECIRRLPEHRIGHWHYTVRHSDGARCWRVDSQHSARLAARRLHRAAAPPPSMVEELIEVPVLPAEIAPLPRARPPELGPPNRQPDEVERRFPQ